MKYIKSTEEINRTVNATSYESIYINCPALKILRTLTRALFNAAW